MAYILCLATSLVILLSLFDHVTPAGTSAKINNGEKNKRKNLYTVWIEYDGNLICGGSLIADRWVLTAVACLPNEVTTSYRVVVGDTFLKKEDGEMYFTVAKLFLNPSWVPGSLANAAALMYLSAPVNVSLSNVDVTDFTGIGIDKIQAKNRACTLSSYGDVAVNVSAKYRQKLTVVLKDDSLCSDNQPGYTSDNICYEDKKYKRRTDRKACRGDEGSPIVCKVGKTYKQIAINLEGGCLYSKNLGLALTSSEEWIRNTMSDYQGLAGDVTEDYPNQEILISGQYQLYWRTNATTIVYEVHVATQGWVGLGISDSGSMWPGDVVVGQFGDDGSCQVMDYHTIGFQKPVIDPEQNVQLMACRQVKTGTMLKFSRPLNSGDSDDRRVKRRGNHVIFAYGTDNILSYHFSRRGATYLYLLGAI